MRRWWVVWLIAATAGLAWWASASDASSSLRGTAPVAHAADDCASLGDAAQFVVLSDGDFNSSASSGTSVTGRIAAAGDITLDGISVHPATGDTGPTIIAGGNFTGGRTTGAGGSVTGAVTYGGTADIAQNFTISGGASRAAPPFSFDDEFKSLATLSASLADLTQTPGATVNLNPNSFALELTGTGTGLNVFTVTAAQLSQAAGIVINLTQAGATALINVVSDTNVSVAPMYINLSGSATAAGIVWNLPLVTTFAVNRGVAWPGLILAPNASVTGTGHPQLSGQLIAMSVPSSDWVFNKTASTVCLPPPPVPPAPPDETLQLTALCVDANGDLDMRLRNTGDRERSGTWTDTGGTDFGAFDVPPGSDLFFIVNNPTAQSVIRATTSDGTTVSADGTLTPCSGQLTVHLVVVGDGPPGQTWVIRVTGGTTGNVVHEVTLADGDTQTIDLLGGYTPGVAPIDQVVGGLAFTISEEDAHGAQVTISLNPVEILDGQNEFVTVTNTFASSGGGGGVSPPVEPEQPEQPTLPPGVPDPPPGPDFIGGGRGGADMAITQKITPSRLPVDGIVETVTQVRNVGSETADGVVAREIPQLRPLAANTVAHVLSLTTTGGKCNQIRPVHCELGTMAPGAVVTIRTRTRILVAASLHSVVVVSSETPDANTANNMAVAGVATFLPATAIRARVSAPPFVPFGRRFSYRVSVSGGKPTGASAVRLCTRPPSVLLQVRASGTYRSGALYCRDILALPRDRSVSFLVSAVPSRSGRLKVDARATAANLPRESRDTAPVLVGAIAVCPAVVTRTQPVARAAC
jgi:choice-of-anchor A domain-containing protein